MTPQALLGYDREVTHLDGHVVELHEREITNPGWAAGVGADVTFRSGQGHCR